jgi:hypothetical protein
VGGADLEPGTVGDAKLSLSAAMVARRDANVDGDAADVIIGS